MAVVENRLSPSRITLLLKQRLVGTLLGRSLERYRELQQLPRVLYLKPEQAGIVGADICTRILRAKLCRPNHVFLDIGAHIGAVIAEVERFAPAQTPENHRGLHGTEEKQRAGRGGQTEVGE